MNDNLMLVCALFYAFGCGAVMVVALGSAAKHYAKGGYARWACYAATLTVTVGWPVILVVDLVQALAVAVHGRVKK